MFSQGYLLSLISSFLGGKKKRAKNFALPLGRDVQWPSIVHVLGNLEHSHSSPKASRLKNSGKFSFITLKAFQVLKKIKANTKQDKPKRKKTLSSKPVSVSTVLNSCPTTFEFLMHDGPSRGVIVGNPSVFIRRRRCTCQSIFVAKP